MNDKRTVFTDALETLGMLIDEHQKRDAIHLAVEPVIAGEDLKPGQNIGIGRQLRAKYAYSALELCVNRKYVGIVDPFLKDYIQEGQRFWMIIYPRQITSLRHVWEHPDFDDTYLIPESPIDKKLNSKQKSVEWLNRYAASLGYHSYHEFIDDFEKILDIDEYYIHPAVWKHFNIITGKENNVLVQKSAKDLNEYASYEGMKNVKDFVIDVYHNKEKKESWEWLETYASSLGNYTANELIEAAKNFLETDTYYFGKEEIIDGVKYYPDLTIDKFDDIFWKHFQIITGIYVPLKEQKSFFSCSC